MLPMHDVFLYIHKIMHCCGKQSPDAGLVLKGTIDVDLPESLDLEIWPGNT